MKKRRSGGGGPVYCKIHPVWVFPPVSESPSSLRMEMETEEAKNQKDEHEKNLLALFISESLVSLYWQIDETSRRGGFPRRDNVDRSLRPVPLTHSTHID